VRPLTSFLLASLLAGALVTAQAGREEGHLTFAVTVDLVVLNATVTDGRGRHAAGLTAGDFRLFEDGRPQEITLFNAGDVPASVGLIIDNSGSMLDKRAEVTAAAMSFIGASHADDEMFVVNFNEQAYLGLPASIRFTNDVARLRFALFAAPTGLTALYDALALGLAHVNTGTRERKALVVLSDGGDNASSRTLDAVLQLARRSSATIYTIGMYDDSNRDRNPRVLRQVAELSGGRAYFPRAVRDLEQVWRDIAGGIRSQYTLGYHSSNPARDGAFRKVRITASRNGEQGLRVTAREGYVAPAGASTAR
jgi:VWFA-related protein